VTGAVIEGSYRAGWQDVLHGASNEEIAGSQAKNKFQKALNIAKEIGLNVVAPGEVQFGTGVYDAYLQGQYHYGQTARYHEMRFGWDPRYPSRIPEALTLEQFQTEQYSLDEWVKNKNIIESMRK